MRGLDPQVLTTEFGQQGEHFRKLAQGVDDRRVVPDREAKSISHETNFAADISDPEALRAWLLELTKHVVRRMRRQKRRGRTVNLKIRFANFRTITRAKSLPHATDVTQALPRHPAGIWLLGVGVSGFADDGFVQKTLFDDEGQKKQRQLDAVTDAVREKFGSITLNRASGLQHRAKHRPDPNAESGKGA